jgi:hypothetical protein
VLIHCICFAGEEQKRANCKYQAVWKEKNCVLHKLSWSVPFFERGLGCLDRHSDLFHLRARDKRPFFYCCVDMESELEKKPVVEEKVSVEGQNMHHDSMVTVRLSEPPVLTLDTKRHSIKVEGAKDNAEHELADADIEDKRRTITDTRSMKSAEESSLLEDSPRITMLDPNGNEVCTPTGSETAESEPDNSRRDSDSSDTSLEEVNWEELEKTEEQQPRNQDSDDVSLKGGRGVHMHGSC